MGRALSEWLDPLGVDHSSGGGHAREVPATWSAPPLADLALVGLSAALRRLDDALHAEVDPHVPLFESLQWLYALDQGHSVAAKAQGADYYAKRDGDDDGLLLKALICARGLTLHRLLRAEREEGLYPGASTYPGPEAFPGVTWLWAALPDADRADPYGARPLYGARVEGHELRPPLAAAARFLSGLTT